MRLVVFSRGGVVAKSGDQEWLFGAPEDIATSIREAGMEVPDMVLLTTMRAPGVTQMGKPVVTFKEKPLSIDGLSATPLKRKHGTDFEIVTEDAKVLFSERGDVAAKELVGYDLAIIKNKHRGDGWDNSVITWPWPDAEYDVSDHNVIAVDTTFKIYSKLSEAPANLKTMDGAALSLEQVNWIVKIADGIPKGEVDNPWAVAKGQFKKNYHKEGNGWVKNKGGQREKEATVSKEEANYRDGAGSEVCSNCANWDGSKSNIVIGADNPKGICDYYQVPAAQEEVMSMVGNEVSREMTKEAKRNSDGRTAEDFLVVGDDEKPSTWQLPIRTNGKPDHKLMGAASAVLTVGYRGNKYEGPDKAKAIKRLAAMYKSEELDLPENLDKVTKEMTGEGPVRRLGDVLVADLHTAYNNFSDSYYREGFMNEEERKQIGAAIGEALKALRANLPEELQQRQLDYAVVKSLETTRQAFKVALLEQFSSSDGTYRYIMDVDEDSRIAYVSDNDTYRSVPYDINDGGNITFSPMNEWGDAMQVWVPRLNRSAYAPLFSVPIAMKELAPCVPDEIETSWATVFKDEDGNDRWVSITSTAVWDRQKELVPPEAMDWAIKFGGIVGRGPLRFKHAPGLDGGICDRQHQVGGFLFETGTFDDSDMGRAMKELLQNDPTWQISPGLAFSRRDLVDGRYARCAIFERSMTKIPANPVTSILSDGGTYQMKQLTQEELKQAAEELKLDLNLVTKLHKQALGNASQVTGLKEFKEYVLKEVSKDKKSDMTDEEEEALTEEEKAKKVKEILGQLNSEQRKELRSVLEDMDQPDAVEQLKSEVEELKNVVTKSMETMAKMIAGERTKEGNPQEIMQEFFSQLPRRQAAQFATKDTSGQELDANDQAIMEKLKAIEEQLKKQSAAPLGPDGDMYNIFTSKQLNQGGA